jgi:hypothetical protein
MVAGVLLGAGFAVLLMAYERRQVAAQWLALRDGWLALREAEEAFGRQVEERLPWLH